MLSSIHPLGERAKNNSFALTAASFVFGSLVGGLLVGAVAAAGAALIGLVLNPTAAAVVFAALAVVAAVAEWRGVRLPSWRRQVSEDWLTTYRGWVYGAGFGLQLGAGVLTIVTSAAVPLALAAALLTGNPAAAMLICAAFGLARGLSILVVARVETSDDLFRFHRRLQSTAGPVRTVAGSVLAITGVAVAATVSFP
jgi:hypothetical protein